MSTGDSNELGVTAEDPAPRRRVAIIGTGGSISVEGRDRLDLTDYGESGRVLTIDELMAHVPEMQTVADVVPVPFATLLSNTVGVAEWLELGACLERVVEEQPDVAGIVVTHGTATLEETAYFLSLTTSIQAPTVLVGALRPPTGLSTDALLNLLGAVRVAASPAARGLGVVCVMNGEIHAARDVTKTSTFDLGAFRSPDLGPLGQVYPDGTVVLERAALRRSAGRAAFALGDLEPLPRVDIAFSYAGADRTAIDAFVDRGAKAVVSAGFAPGLVTAGEWDALCDARAQGVVVVQSSRCGSGRVLRLDRFTRNGIVVADNLTPQKARILAMLALTRTVDPGEVQRVFDDY